MPLVAKRLSPSLMEMAPLPDTTKEDDRADRMAKSIEQLTAGRALFIDLAQRFGKGGSLWATKGWGWEEPDWAADPETWPPVAKLLWLFDRMVNVEGRLGMLRHFSASPEFCDSCGPKPGEHYRLTICDMHGSIEGVKTMARDLYGAAAVSK